MTLDWEGKHYELEIDTITAREFRSIKQHTGLKAGQFIRAFSSLDDLDGDAAIALLWLAKTRAGEAASFEDDVQVLKLLASVGKPDVPEDEVDSPKG